MTSKIKEDFFAITNAISHSTLSGNEKMVAAFVASFCRQDKDCYASNEYLGWLVTLTARTGGALIKSLKDKNVITTTFTSCSRGTERVIKFIGIPKEIQRGKFESKEAKIVVTSKETKMNNKKKAIVDAMIEYGVGDKEQAEDALIKYDAAYELFKNDSNVNIQEAPNDMIIMKLMESDWVVGAEIDGFIEVLTSRFNARLLKGKKVNLSWLIMTELDEMTRDGILSTEG